MKDYVLFHLARHAPKGYPDFRPDLTLYDQIRLGLKTIEYRFIRNGFDDHMLKSLLISLTNEEKKVINTLHEAGLGVDLTKILRIHKARFVEGYPKNSLPRLEADITGATLWGKAFNNRLDVNVSNIKEVKESPTIPTSFYHLQS